MTDPYVRICSDAQIEHDSLQLDIKICYCMGALMQELSWNYYLKGCISSQEVGVDMG